MGLPGGKIDLAKLEQLKYNPDKPQFDGFKKQRAFLERLINFKDTEKPMHNAHTFSKRSSL